jgi:predicted dehydrogenase
MNAPLRVGIIGFGYWGPNLVRNFSLAENTTVAMISDRDEKKRKIAQATYPAVRVTADGNDIINDPNVDAVAIATPISTHFPFAKAALEAGKHVLVEKPMAQTTEEARILIDLAKKKNLTLMVGHTFLYTGAVRKMRELIESGEMGELYYFDSVRFNLGLLQHDVNVIWDLAPHDLSIVLYLMDERPESLQAIAHRHVGQKQEEIATLTLLYKSGFHANISLSWISPVKLRTTLLAGSKKMVVYDDIEPSEKVRVYDKGVTMPTSGPQEVTAFNPIYRAGDVLIPALDRTEALRKEVTHFVECARTQAKPLTDGYNGLAVVALMEAAQTSVSNNGAFVPLPASVWK